jgi:hypothetical protein
MADGRLNKSVALANSTSVALASSSTETQIDHTGT